MNTIRKNVTSNFHSGPPTTDDTIRNNSGNLIGKNGNVVYFDAESDANAKVPIFIPILTNSDIKPIDEKIFDALNAERDVQKANTSTSINEVQFDEDDVELEELERLIDEYEEQRIALEEDLEDYIDERNAEYEEMMYGMAVTSDRYYYDDYPEDDCLF